MLFHPLSTRQIAESSNRDIPSNSSSPLAIMNQSLHGLVAATHTPFHPDASLAPEVVPVQAAYLARQGLKIVFITGSTGEGHSLTRNERIEIYKAWAATGPHHDIRVVAHVGSNCLEDAKYLAAAAADLGLFATATIAPNYYKPSSITSLVDWCAAIATAAPELPFYYYDMPSVTDVRFATDRFLIEALPRIPNLAGVKFTNSDLETYQRCLAVMDGRFDIPWGIDELLVEALALGAKGAVGSSYNFAAPLYLDLIAAFDRGDLESARSLQQRALAMIEAIAVIGYLGAAKAVMAWNGVPVGPARQPIDNPTHGQLEALREQLSELGVLGEMRV